MDHNDVTTLLLGAIGALPIFLDVILRHRATAAPSSTRAPTTRASRSKASKATPAHKATMPKKSPVR